MTVVGPSVPIETMENGVLAAVFDLANTCLNVTNLGAANSTEIPHDEQFVWSHVFDHVTNTLRVVEV